MTVRTSSPTLPSCASTDRPAGRHHRRLGRAEAGQHPLAIGSALGTLPTTVTSGVVSALGRDVVVDDPCGTRAPRSLRNLIQTDAAINAGNSGGALVDSKVTSSVSTRRSGAAVQAIGFAIPINIAKPIMQQAIDDLLLTSPWVGIHSCP